MHSHACMRVGLARASEFTEDGLSPPRLLLVESQQQNTHRLKCTVAFHSLDYLREGDDRVTLSSFPSCFVWALNEKCNNCIFFSIHNRKNFSSKTHPSSLLLCLHVNFTSCACLSRPALSIPGPWIPPIKSQQRQENLTESTWNGLIGR